MQSKKITTVITIESLSTEVVPGILVSVGNRLREEIISGGLQFSDGDKVIWETSTKDVEIE